MLLVNVLLLTGTAEAEVEQSAVVRMFRASNPDWNGVLLRPRQSADLVLDVIDKAAPEESGGFVSQYGNKRWL